MKIGVPSTLVGDRFEILTVREPNDPETTIYWTICIFNMSNTVVFMDVLMHRVGIDNDIKSHMEIIDHLSSGVYRVHVYYGNHLFSGCDSIPEDQLRYVFYIHKAGSDVVTLSMHSSWYPEREHIFIMYVRDGIPFYTSSTGRAVGIPVNTDVFVEVTGSDNKAFVGVVNTSSDISVLPNTTIPFRAVLRIRLNVPLARYVANAYAEMLGFGRGVIVNVVDDYTFELEIIKTEVGLSGVAAAIAILLLVVVLAMIVAVIVSMVVSVDQEKLAIIKDLIEKRERLVNNFMNEYDACGNDEYCRRRVERKYLHLWQGYDSAIGSLSRFGIGACNGINLGNICVPWWVVAIAIFLAGLLVISAVK